MKRLILIRHAKSSWTKPHLADIDRPLNKRGKRDAPFMAGRLHQMGIEPDLIYTSPAKRARKTAKHIAQGVGYPVEKIVRKGDIYTSDINILMAVIRGAPANVTTLFLVGHNYVLTELAEFFTGEVLINVPTAGIVAMHFNCDSWQMVNGGLADMDFFDYPKKHRQGGTA
ncbi:histidine phosphatase family protein [Desulfopila sp. IMCC35008]|uniref:SixA phosphatase family protein n=1 Tax=Desulfopila sp. IMCC35008 TaxID=2653858 RepID=UPI0013CF4171|nr:histidine phosphatase family protein [Desulfopila sp. IMCC35008]